MQFSRGGRTRPSVHVVATLTLSLMCVGAVGEVRAASPSLNLVLPRGMQRGADNVVTFSGGQLGDAQEVFFYEPGFQVTKIEPKDANNFAATVKVLPECRLGEHVAQVRTKTGISEYRTFYVGALPIIDEKEPNSEFAAPQKIGLNVTIHGVIDNEDVDYFAIDAKKGQRIAVEIEAMRLGITLCDPYIAIMDSKRFELAAKDDSPLLLQDGAASILAPEDGTYIVQVRDSAYGGNGSCYYRLHVGTFPRPTAVYPAGGKIGEEVEVKFIGDAAGDFTAKYKLPAAVEEDYGLLAIADKLVAPSENSFRLSTQPNALEVEPNNAVAQATSAQLPMAFNGVIGAPGDTDFFKFTAKKGEVYEVECYARRLRSPLDSVMYICNSKGGVLIGNDDAKNKDSYFRYTFPEDGEYLLQLTDHLGRGGPDYVYRVEFAPVKPTLNVQIPRVARYSQYRQQIYVPKGNRFATLINVVRSDFGGPIVLDPKDLPAGIKMIAQEMPANLDMMPVVFEAAADAPLAGKLVDFRAKHADPNVKIDGGFYNRADFVIAEPGQSLFRWRDVNKVAVAVVDELPFHIEIVEPKVPLVRYGSMDLKIVAKRKEGFTAPITVEFPFRPPGVGAASSVVIPEKQNEVVYPLSADGGAEIRKWPIFAIGSAEVGGAGWAASQLASLEVADRFLQFTIDRADVELGKETGVFCKLQINKPFEGAAKVQLLGLPAKVTTTDLDITKDTKELTFKVKTDPASPVGTHKSIFCRVVVTEKGEPVVHSYVGETELRIDQPIVKPVAAAPATPAPAAAAPAAPAAPEKRLTRLEKLRLEAKQAAGGK